MRVALNQVSELRRRGHDVLLMAGWNEREPAPESVDGIRVRTFPAIQLVPKVGATGLVSRRLYSSLTRSLSAADLLHVHGGRDLTTVSALVAGKLQKTPIFLQTHGMLAPDSRLRARLFDRLFTRRLTATVSCCFALVSTEALALRQVVGGEVLIKNLKNGLTSGPSRRYKKYGGQIQVLYCARLHKRKRPLAFVEAAAQVKNPNATFAIVGPDEGELTPLQTKISEMQLAEKVVYEGALAYENVLDRMRDSDIYVLPSIDEPFPMSLLEAMSLGIPSICTDSTGISKLLAEKDAAVVTDGSPTEIAAAIDELVSNRLAREAVGRRAQQLVDSNFSITAVVDELEQAYQSILALGARHPVGKRRRG
jgi:glycosyltransferase involved in cell wall biosynthesis